MQTDGFIKLSRNIMDWRWYKNPNTLRLFLHLLLCANYTDGEFENYTIKRGQVVTGRKKLSEDLSMSVQEVRTALEHLKSTNEITIKRTSKFSIITVLKYDEFQKSTNTSTIKQPTSNHQSTNKQPQYNKYNKNNKYNNKYSDTKNDLYTLSDDEIAAFKSKSLYTD